MNFIRMTFFPKNLNVHLSINCVVGCSDKSRKRSQAKNIENGLPTQKHRVFFSISSFNFEEMAYISVIYFVTYFILYCVDEKAMVYSANERMVSLYIVYA